MLGRGYIHQDLASSFAETHTLRQASRMEYSIFWGSAVNAKLVCLSWRLWHQKTPLQIQETAKSPDDCRSRAATELPEQGGQQTGYNLTCSSFITALHVPTSGSHLYLCCITVDKKINRGPQESTEGDWSKPELWEGASSPPGCVQQRSDDELQS